MRSALLRSSKLVVPAFLVGVLLSALGAPLWRELIMLVMQDRYGELVFKCDMAMREHMLAKQRLVETPSDGNVDLLEMAQLGLLDCQDYDLMRKRLIQFGLGENELSLMGLKAIEERAVTLQQVVEIHEIRY